MRAFLASLVLAAAGLATAGEEGAGLPEGIRGFRGMAAGTLVSKTEAAFVLKVDKITRVWKQNRATNPECIVGREVPIRLWRGSRLCEQHLKTLAEMKPGDRVIAEPFHLEPDHEYLSVVEELKKAEEPAEEPSTLPEGIRGFRGMLVGSLVEKGEEAFVLKVEKITRTWKENKATNPECIVGERIEVRLSTRFRLYEQHKRTLAELKPGDRVEAEPFHFGGNTLTLVEVLRKVE